MMKYLTEKYEPQRVLRHFEDICSIPQNLVLMLLML